MESAALLRRKADAAVKAGRYAEASDLYAREAAIYRKNGDVNGAKVQEMRSDRYRSGIQLFAHLKGARIAAAAPKAGALAKWEPAYGCYVGGFIDRDERLGRAFVDENHQKHYAPSEFSGVVRKKHASVFCYCSYGRPFPARWVAHLRSYGVAPHIAWEPNGGLAAVRDDAYLRSFAEAAARARCPIFLRFASEMNGDWTRYGGNARAYKEKWALVKRVMERYAPNVAMVWCVNCIPEKPIADFYPGDDLVDWVGVNFYAVPFRDNDVKRPGLHENPADSLKYVYGLYAGRKPIQVCEFGASRVSAVDRKDRSEWAASKIRQLYAALPRIYPRVKAINIFDCDNMTYAMPGRQLNNYSVTDSDRVLMAYREAVSDDYFLGEVESGASTSTGIVPVPEAGLTVPRGILRVSAWARCYTDRYSVVYSLDGREVATSRDPGPREVKVDLDGPQAVRTLAATIRDEAGRVACRKEFKLKVT